MNWSRHITFRIQKEAGFRFNLLDVGLLLCVCAVTFVLHAYRQDGYLYLMPLYVGFTFFQFCNIFRIGNRLEPFWYVPFVIALLLLHERPAVLWAVILLVFEPLKLGLVLICLRRGTYHGAWWSKLQKGDRGKVVESHEVRDA